MVMESIVNDAIQETMNDGIEGDKKVAKQGHGPDEAMKIGLVDNSNGANRDIREGDKLADDSIPRDAVDEWPAEKKIYNFYVVRYRTFDDPKLKVKIDHADREVTKCTQARIQITDALKTKRAERSQVIAQLKPLTAEDKQYRQVMDDKRKAMEPLQDALGKLRSANIAVRDKGIGLCSSEEELNDLIYSLNYRMQHESLTLSEEKQLIKDIKLLEGTREKVIANASEKAKIQDSLGHKEAIQDQVKLINDDIGGIRKEKQAIRMKIKELEDELKVIDDEIISLQEELETINKKRNKAYETLVELRKGRDETNACFYQNRSLLNRAKDLAAKKDVASLDELIHCEVEKFMSEWSSKKEFRDDYERRILSSLDIRQLSRDGRMRNPDEKPIVVVEAPIITRDLEPAPAKVSTKQVKEEAVPQQEVMPKKKGSQETKSKKSTHEVVESREKAEDSAGNVNDSAPEKSQKEAPKANEIDATKLKEMKREEEIAKAKQALERKKKLAEKAAAKAAVRAQKEAEKKLKQQEKKAKKKAVASAAAESTDEAESESKVSEPEEAAAAETTEAPAAVKPKDQKENAVRYRTRGKTRDQVPRIILKRKKAQSYWMWAAPTGAAVAALFATVGYYYFAFIRK